MRRLPKGIAVALIAGSLIAGPAIAVAVPAAGPNAQAAVKTATLRPRTFGSSSGAEYFTFGVLTGWYFHKTVTPATYTCVLQKRASSGLFYSYATIKRTTAVGACGYWMPYNGTMKGTWRWYVPAGNGGTGAYSSAITITR